MDGSTTATSVTRRSVPRPRPTGRHDVERDLITALYASANGVPDVVTSVLRRLGPERAARELLRILLTISLDVEHAAQLVEYSAHVETIVTELEQAANAGDRS